MPRSNLVPIEQNRYARVHACSRRARMLYDQDKAREKSHWSMHHDSLAFPFTPARKPEKVAVLEEQAGLLKPRLVPRGERILLPTPKPAGNALAAELEPEPEAA